MTVLTPLALAAALATAQAPASPAPAAAAGQPRAIHVTGEGRASAAPDVARVTIGVAARDAASLARATAEASARMKKVLAALEKGGVAARDVRTVRHDVEVQRSYDKPGTGTVTGYLVTSQVAVTVRDLAKLGALLDQVVAAGSNAVDGLVLDKEDTSAERARALEAAVADARAKAAVLAKASGVTLGEVVLVAESTPGAIPLPQQGFLEARAAKAFPIATGQLEVVATVELTYAIR